MLPKKPSLEEGLLKKIRDGDGDINGLKELAEEYNIQLRELINPIKKLYEKNLITGIEKRNGEMKLVIVMNPKKR